MTSNDHHWLPALGFLRMALLGLALLNIMLPLIELTIPFAARGAEHDLWSVLSTMIAPVTAPLLLTVILFDYIMSKVRAADSDGALRASWITVARIELAALGLLLLFWVPYFIFQFF